MPLLPIPFARWTTYQGHSGVDFPNSNGTPILASGPGIVGLLNKTTNGGYITWIDYDNPRIGVGYAHQNAHYLKKGQRVKEGDVIGYVGYSGHVVPPGPGGSHLHIEIANQPGEAAVWRYFDKNRVVNGGGASMTGTQRQVVPHATANGRAEPSSKSALVGEPLAPNTVGNFNGWIHGEAVEGNKVWFRGTSGRWFWSGGFTDVGTHDLEDLNSALSPTQRQAVAAGANGRIEPTTAAAITSTLGPNAVGDFNGWINGQSVENNSVWFRGAHSGAFFWSGGFTDKGTHDLEDLNVKPPEPTPGPERTTVAVGAKVRSAPYDDAAEVGFIPGGETRVMTAWADADPVEGNDVWFQHAGGWSWSGGFTNPSAAGLTQVAAPPKPTEPTDWNPMGLVEYTPVYPGAVIGLEAPLGFLNCDVNGTRAPRTSKGTPPVATSGVLSLFIIHWAWPAGDDKRFFSTCNSGSSCPTTYTDKNGETGEFIRPGAKPASTGKEWNWRSWAWEVEPINDGTNPDVPPISDAQIDEAIEQIVFLREHDGKMLDGAPVEFKIDREHVIGDRDTRVTECPGDYLYGKIPWIIEEAQRRYDERHPAPTPGGGTLDPAEYPNLAELHEEIGRAFGMSES